MQPQSQSEIIQTIPVDSFVWSESESAAEIKQLSSFQIYTVSKSIKNPQILEHIKPDYGSLGEFMKNVGISKDILLHNRKKKNELQEDAQQKKMRSTLKEKNLDKIIRLQTSSQLQKTVASKMIVQNLFESKFGTTLNNFCSQNNKPQNNKHKYSTVGELTSMLDDLMIRTKQDTLVHFAELKNEAPVLYRKKNQISSKEVRDLTLSQRIQKIRNLQQNYPSLKKIPQFIIQTDQCISHQLSNNTFQLSSSTPTFAYLAAQLLQLNLTNLKYIRLANVNMTFELLSFMLDYFSDNHCYGLRQLIIEGGSFGSSEKVAVRIKEFIQQSHIHKVKLIELGLTSRDFCFISLGIGMRSGFEFMGVRGNKIGEIAKKCLDVLLKFNKQTKFDFSNNPIEKQIKGKPGYARCFP